MTDPLKATVEYPRGNVEKLSPEGGDTVRRGSVRAPKGFSKGKPNAQPLMFFSSFYIEKTGEGHALVLTCTGKNIARIENATQRTSHRLSRCQNVLTKKPV